MQRQAKRFAARQQEREVREVRAQNVSGLKPCQSLRKMLAIAPPTESSQKVICKPAAGGQNFSLRQRDARQKIKEHEKIKIKHEKPEAETKSVKAAKGNSYTSLFKKKKKEENVKEKQPERCY